MLRLGILTVLLLGPSVNAEPPHRATIAAIAQGDIQSAIVLWQVHSGRQDIPGWLRAFQSAFDAANQRAGPCIDVAKSIFAGFRNLGKEPKYLKFTSEGTQRGANLLAFEIRAGDPRSTIQISDNFVHYAVQVESRIYDAFTGPQGLAVAEYTKRLISPLGKITTETVSILP
jgi:hypothetical protein